MATEAQKRAREKYNKENYKVINFKVNKKTEKELIDHLEAQENKQGYIKELIRQDIEMQKSIKKIFDEIKK